MAEIYREDYRAAEQEIEKHVRQFGTLLEGVQSLAEENAELWEYVWAMEAFNVWQDHGRQGDPTAFLARINAAQRTLKERYERGSRPDSLAE